MTMHVIRGRIGKCWEGTDKRQVLLTFNSERAKAKTELLGRKASHLYP